MMAREPLVLGTYELQERVASGGVGDVWRATHLQTRAVAAVKLLHAGGARDPAALQTLRAELRAVAGLDHPNIVYVFGTGEVCEQTAAQAKGRLVLGATWIAMEFAEGGTLRDSAGAMAWTAVREAMLDVLAGLAHAHARGVLHGDVKPANLLVGGMRPGVKIADFGLAHLLGAAARERGSRRRWGTPSYMAPEQINGVDGLLGPWTDLYSAGCTAWALLTGAAPFVGEPEAVLDEHVSSPLPAFVPNCAVPDGAEAWLRRCLVKDPSLRLRHAADAGRMLRELPATLSGPAPRAATRRAAPAEVTVPLAGLVHAVRVLANTDLRPLSTTVPATFPTRPLGERPLPRGVAGAGLELLGLRSLPVVGREAEQDFLWSRLRQVFDTETSRAVIVRGASGVGTSRLVRWLSESAAELGVARPVVAWYGTGSGPARGLRPAFSRAMGLPRLDRASLPAALLRVAPALDDSDRSALIAWLGSGGRQGAAGLPRAERLALWRRVLLAMASAPPPTGEGRPIVFWVDDAHTGAADALALIRSVIGLKMPVLFVLTVTDELLPARSVEASMLADLRAQVSVEELRLTPLAEAASRELLEQRLGLDRAFADSVTSRTSGNPLFALQLLGDSIQRGLLEFGPEGVHLRAGAAVELPLDLERVWALRVESAAAGLPASALESVELLAVLGDPVDEAEWVAACAELGVPPGRELVERLEARGLLPRAQGGGAWRFVHAMFREALERRAGRAGRLDACHRACAAMLRLGAERESAERIGRHLRAAGDLGGSLQPLATAIESRILSREARPAAVLLQMRDEALSRIGVRPDDARHAEQRFLEALLAQLDNDLGRAEAKVVELLADAHVHEWPGIEARALWLRGRIARRRGNAVLSRDCLGNAALAASAGRDRRTVARARADLGDVLTDLGDWAGASESFEGALPLFRELDDALGLGEVHLGLAQLDLKRERRDHAEAGLQYALAEFARVGNRVGLARVYNLLGDLARFGGNTAVAADHYRAAVALLEAVSSWMAVVPQVNLGLLLVGDGLWAAARSHLEPCLAEVQRHPAPDVEVCARLALLVCAVAVGDAALEAAIAPSEAQMTEVRRRDPELRALIGLVREQALLAGRADRVLWADTALAV
ncbi:hypothetical protein LBMAG42_09470 [Deltaproteobacteria bacterium]|nr:hypothetical protein LBMAG42_09470 [Deltaproteobacteria bacterium]